MIAPLRRSHLRIWLVLTLAIAALLAAALAVPPGSTTLNTVRWKELR